MDTEKENVVEEKVVDETPPAETAPAEEPEASEADLAKAALEATEEQPKVDPKDAVIGGFRRQLREAELRAARAEGALQAKSAAPPEKSPIELAAEQQGLSVNEVIIDGKLYREQQLWEKGQAANQAHLKQVQDYQAGSDAALLAMTDENLGEGLGLESLGTLGEHLLTYNDRQEIFNAGRKCGTVLYKKLKQRIAESGGKEAAELQKRLKPQGKSQLKPKKEQPKTDETEPPAAEEILDAPSAMIEHTFDL